MNRSGRQGGSLEAFKQLSMQWPIAGKDFRIKRRIGRSCKSAYLATRLFDQQPSGSGIPGLQVGFIETIKAAAGDIGQVKGRCPGSANIPRPWENGLQATDDIRQVGVDLVWKPGADKRFNQPVGCGDTDALAVQPGSATSYSIEQLVKKRRVHGRHFGFATIKQGYGDREEWKTVGKIGCSVKRVDHPESLPRQGVGSRLLLGHDRNGFRITGEQVNNDSFGGNVRFSDQVDVAFQGDTVRLVILRFDVLPG